MFSSNVLRKGLLSVDMLFMLHGFMAPCGSQGCK